MGATDTMWYCAEKKVILMYVGATLKGIDTDRKILTTNLVCAAIKGMSPTFFSVDCECFSAQDLINVACKFIYRGIEAFFYKNGKINKEAFEGCDDPKNERTAFLHALTKVLDFKHFKDVNVYDVCSALESNTDPLIEGVGRLSEYIGDTGDGLKCQRLIEKVVCDYRSASA